MITKEQYKPYRAQRVINLPVSPTAPDWRKVEITTIEKNGSRIDERVTLQTAHGWPFIDIGIEHYVGVTRRAKYVSCRLEEQAARRLYELLAEKFAP